MSKKIDKDDPRLNMFHNSVRDLYEGITIPVEDETGKLTILEGRDIGWHKIILQKELEDIELVKKAVAIIEDPEARKAFIEEEARVRESMKLFFHELRNAVRYKARKTLHQLRMNDPFLAKDLDDTTFDELVDEVLAEYDSAIDEFWAKE